MSKLSIITVALNSGSKLTDTVKTVLDQDYDDWELIVKDGGSTDDSIERLKKLLAETTAEKAARIRIISEKDTGIYDAMNHAAGYAEGEYLYFLNCGDLLMEQTVLSRFMGKLKEHPGSLIYYGNVYDNLRNSVVQSNPKMDAFACYRNLPCHQACVYHRSLFEERGYNTSYRIRADYEHFLWCFFEKKAQPVFLNVVLASYEGGGFSETKKNREISAREHREIVSLYMTKGQLFRFRLILLLTLQPLRTAVAENPVMGKWYQAAKKLLYR